MVKIKKTELRKKNDEIPSLRTKKELEQDQRREGDGRGGRAVDTADADTRESMTDPREGVGEGVALLMRWITRTLSRTDCW